jgi:biotin carboxyl carrier protein
MTTTRLGHGCYRVVSDDRAEIVYVAGTAADPWAFWNGRVFRITPPAEATPRRWRGIAGRQALTAPMPATVIRVLVEPGATVRKGDTIILLEAMKMELPLRAPDDAVVKAVLCEEGELVQPDTPLVELE